MCGSETGILFESVGKTEVERVRTNRNESDVMSRENQQYACVLQCRIDPRSFSRGVRTSQNESEEMQNCWTCAVKKRSDSSQNQSERVRKAWNSLAGPMQTRSDSSQNESERARGVLRSTMQASAGHSDASKK